MDRLEPRGRRLATFLVVGTGLIVIAVTLFRVSLASVVSVGVLLICPLLMLGMHRGHDGRHGVHASVLDHRRMDPVIRPEANPPSSSHLVGPEGGGSFAPIVRARTRVSDRRREV